MNWIKKTFALLFGAVFSLAFAIPCFSKAETVTAATETGFRFNSTNTYKMERLLTQTPLSYEASFKLTASEAATGNGYFLGNYTNPQNGAIITFRIGTDGTPILYLRQYDSTYDYWMKFGDVNVATGQKVHLAITTDKTNFYCYVNGTLKQTLQKDAGKMEIDTTFPFKVPMRVGGDDQSGESQYFKGELYSLSLFADTRTASEVSTDVSSLNTTDEHLMAAYDFTGTTQNQSKILDLSKNKFHLYNVSTEWEWSTTSKYDPNDYAFSFMVVGDTQTVMRRNEIDKANGVIQEGNTYMDKIYDYIVDNVQKKKVKHVMGLGDITDFNAKNEWDEAKRVTEKMDGVVPYSLVRGNHDLATNWFANDVLKRSPDVEPYFVYDYVGGGVGSPNNGTVDTAKCDRYFATYFSMNSSYGQQVAYCYNSSTNNTIHFFTGTDNLEYMVVALDYGPTDAMLNWASNIIQQYPNHNVIVTTHGYMWADGSHIVYSTTGGMSTNFGENGNAANCGDDLWNEFLSKHANISMLICGHVDTPTIVYRKDQGINGNVVTQMLCDPQGMDANNYNQPLVQKYGDSAANRLVGMVATYYVTADGKNID
ncbi:MAG: metallophosphoesterase, partial [Clostridia bacterium]|nr:metallophosphoesterase [Clostridia bacterium]